MLFAMPKLRVGVLYDVWDDGTEEAAEDKVPRRKRRREKHDHEEVFEALKKLGHDPFYHVLDGHAASLHALADQRADLYFNLAESYAGATAGHRRARAPSLDAHGESRARARAVRHVRT